MKKIVSLFLAMVMLLTLCAGALAEERVLHFASASAPGETYAIWESKMAEEFTEATGIEVEIDFAGRDVLNKYRPAILTGNSPDIITRSHEDIYGALLANEVLLQSLNPFLFETEGPEGEARMIDIFSEDALRLYSPEGDENIYMIPYKVNTSGFFYNTKIFEQYQLSEPKTWSEFIQLCDTLVANGVVPFSADGNIHFYNYYYFYWLCERILGTGALRAAAEDPTGEKFRDPGFLEAAKKVAELVKKGYFAEGYEGSAYPAAQADWAMGGSAMMLMGSWLINETKPLIDPETFEYGFFPFPAVEGGAGAENSVEISYVGYAVPVGADYELACEFLRFIMTKEHMAEICEITTSMPARKNLEYPASVGVLQETMDTAMAYHKLYDATQQFDGEWVTNVLYPADDALFFGDCTPEEFIEELVVNTAQFYANR